MNVYRTDDLDHGGAARIQLGQGHGRASFRTSSCKKVVDSQKAWSERVAFYDIMNQADYKLAYEHYFPGKLGF